MNRLRGKLSLGLLVLVTAGIVGVFSAPLALADSKCGGVDTAIISCDPNANGVLEILKLVLQILTGLVGIAAVGALIFAGILYSSASGEQSQVQKAKTMIQNTVIGIILFGTMFLVGNWLIPGGVFGGDIANVSGSTSGGSTGGGNGNDPITTSNSTKFSIVSMPDTQFEVNRDVNNDKGHETLVDDSMKWIVANKAENKSNIQVVVGPGDLTNAGGTHDNAKISAMFKSISRSYKVLDDGGVPYSITSGNHDTDATCTYDGRTASHFCSADAQKASDNSTKMMRSATRLNQTFPTSRAGLKGLTLYKSGEIQNSYRVFRVRNTNWLILTMEMYPRTSVFNWAKQVVASHSTYNVVVVTHGYMGSGTNIINGGISEYCGSNSDCTTPKEIQQQLLKYKNVQMLFSGHVTPDNIRTDTLNDHKVVQFKTTIHACDDPIPCTNPIRTVQIDLAKGTLTSVLCRKVSATSASSCDTQTISGMSYVTSTGGSGSSGGSGGSNPIPASILTGVDNARDIATASPKLIKPGVYYRSAKLQNATSSDTTKLSTMLKNGVIIDLRLKKVRDGAKDQPVPGVDNINYPIEGVSDAAGYKRAFVDSADGRSSLHDAITKIANTSGATLVHCTAGKDRTGWTTAMVMYIVGDGKFGAKDLDALVMNEYLLSRELHPGDSSFNVDESWFNAAMTEAKNKYGSTMGYIRNGLKIDDATITKLKSKLGA